MKNSLVKEINLILGNYDLERLVDGVAEYEYMTEAQLIVDFMSNAKYITTENLAEAIQSIFNERFGTTHSLQDCMYVSDDIIWSI